MQVYNESFKISIIICGLRRKWFFRSVSTGEYMKTALAPFLPPNGFGTAGQSKNRCQCSLNFKNDSLKIDKILIIIHCKSLQNDFKISFSFMKRQSFNYLKKYLLLRLNQYISNAFQSTEQLRLYCLAKPAGANSI